MYKVLIKIIAKLGIINSWKSMYISKKFFNRNMDAYTLLSYNIKNKNIDN